MYKIFDGAFNITNVCNLTCAGCESFNNFAFKNHYQYKDFAHYYEKWSTLVDINIVTIHGGEPFTNPDILNWAKALKDLWPNARRRYVSANGTLIKNHIETCKQLLNLGWYIDISIHDPAFETEIVETIEQVLAGQHYQIVQRGDQIKYVRSNSRTPLFVYYTTTDFISSARAGVEKGKWKFHRSNAEQAHKVCVDGLPPCSYFHKGKLYQCHLTGLAQDIIKQFPIEDHAIDLLNEYQGGDPFEPLDDFFATLHKPMPQCTLCPQSDKTHCIAPMPTKKPLPLL